ncbi:hypothetical protein C9J03_02390 [Photobacterium gaetbulicola]|uniref:Putative glycosyl transferase family protein n=1 Tax=Photobacterium gaetbulicola Gung47 TaxID=658445 RepID=A0A0C5WQP5_9GAMM|nr:glycosyltransferase family 4 protein [Photobacterium gaetbulicola]AJR09498.1 putative glycosyl transferase family protein [Photobacterium gaetbulicola Gung47]PSU14292.1 hypothetical protein C9J03_02390 [Photobacterium gaetbulicola]
MKKEKKILITAPDLNELGGVASHFLGLSKYFGGNVKFFKVGSRNNIPGFLLLPIDLIHFFLKVIFFKPETVLLNPSLQKNAVVRDSFYLKIAKIFKVNVVVFFHGWDPKLSDYYDNNNRCFMDKFSSADAFIVLCSDFKRKLENWGVNVNVYLSTTKVDEKFFNSKSSLSKNILFLARLTEEKGILLAIEAIKRLNTYDDGYTLTVVGDGPLSEKVSSLILNDKISFIKFSGRLSGEKLVDTMADCGCYIFPSFHGEGMPTSVLESMAIGLPVVTTPNAGIKDFFVERKMGSYISFHDVDSIVNEVLRLYEDMDMNEISIFNSKFAYTHFHCEKVANSLLSIINKY